MIQNLYETVLKTGAVFFPLFVFGVVGWYYIVEIFFFIRKENKNSGRAAVLTVQSRFEQILQLGKEKKIESDAVWSECQILLIDKLYVWYEKLKTVRLLSAAAPLLGLIGTVSGMIETFNVIAVFGNSNPTMMADGISEALLTTQAGLIISFPMLFMHVFLQSALNGVKDKLKRRWAAYSQIEV